MRQEAQPPNSTTALWLRSFQRLDFVPGLRDAVQVNCAVAFAEMIDPPYLPRTFLSFSDADLYVITLYCTYLGSSSQPRVPFLNGDSTLDGTEVDLPPCGEHTSRHSGTAPPRIQALEAHELHLPWENRSQHFFKTI